MEADWEAEIDPDWDSTTPVIDASWQGLVDLRLTPERIGEISEARLFPTLGETLLRLNGWNAGAPCRTESSIWTAKCDLWTPEVIDPDEMNATSTECAVALASYIDLLPANERTFSSFGEIEAWVRAVVNGLRQAAFRCCRIDLVIRRAIYKDQTGFGITAYTTACGPDPNAAQTALADAFSSLVDAIQNSARNRQARWALQ